MEIRPLEVPVRMTLAKKGDGGEYFCDYAKPLEVTEISDSCRYDTMVRDLHAFVTGKRENPYTYEHEYTVQKVLDKIVSADTHELTKHSKD